MLPTRTFLRAPERHQLSMKPADSAAHTPVPAIVSSWLCTDFSIEFGRVSSEQSGTSVCCIVVVRLTVLEVMPQIFDQTSVPAGCGCSDMLGAEAEVIGAPMLD